MRILAPSRCRSGWCRCCNGWVAGLRLPATPVLLLLLLATALGGSTGATSLGVSVLGGRVPCTALSGPGTLVCQGEKRSDAFHLVRRQLLEHLLVTYPLAESSNNRCIRDTRNGTPYLGEARDEGPERFSGFLPHGVKVCLHTMLLVRTGEVRCEPRTELFPGLDRPRCEVHEPGPGWPRQGYMKVACHDGTVTTSR